MISPKVFISYSWSNKTHQEYVKHIADRLIDDNVDVILDIYDLKEGDDKYVFMESMLTDETVTHILVLCDKEYAKKADGRLAGVGTESQIISSEIYEKTTQSKFIPIVCEYNEEGEPYLPVFMKTRIWINFSSIELENENWEQLIRLLYGKPQFTKPERGKTPSYILNEKPTPADGIYTKYQTFKNAVNQDRKGINHYRSDFLEACIQFSDKLRVRENPAGNIAEIIIAKYESLIVVRDYVCDWILFESAIASESEFSEILIDFFEKMRELKSRPSEINSWNESWFDGHAIFVFETFLYSIASLIKSNKYKVLYELLHAHYIIPITDSNSVGKFEQFPCFQTFCDAIQSELAPNGQKLLSPVAELIKRHSNRQDIPFNDLIQADLLSVFVATTMPDAYWYPQLSYYIDYSCIFQLFLKASQKRHFDKLLIITGFENSEKLKASVKTGIERLELERLSGPFRRRNFSTILNIDAWNTL